jgi:hypothetical protein
MNCERPMMPFVEVMRALRFLEGETEETRKGKED